MARIRSIKPDFFKNEDIASLPAMVRLLFIGLWTQADREGRLQDRPKRLKAELFPYDNIDIDKSLNDLQNAGFIVRYKVNAETLSPEQTTTELALIQVNNFLKHQVINVKEQQSTLLAQYKNGTSITGKEGKGMGKEQERKGLVALTFEKVFNEITESERWIIDTAMHLGTTEGICQKKLLEFLEKIRLAEDWHKGTKEVKSHFINWLKIEISKEKNSAKKENLTESKDLTWP